MTHFAIKVFNKLRIMDNRITCLIILTQLLPLYVSTMTGNCRGCLICPTEFPNYLTASDIGDTSAVKDLNLNNCSIANMEHRVFRNNKVMKVLRFSWNSLRNISQGYFTDLVSLEQLYIDNGEVDYIDEYAFAETRTLEIISLTHNRLQAIHKKAFQRVPKLAYLDLRYNKLTVLSNRSFAGLSSLRHLRLGNNNLRSVHTSYEWPPNLAWLDLENNKFHILPQLVSCRFKLTFLGNPLYCGCVRTDRPLPKCQVQLACKFPKEKSYIRSTANVNYTNYKPNLSLKTIHGLSVVRDKWRAFTSVMDCYSPQIVIMTQVNDKVICVGESDPSPLIKLISKNVNKKTVRDGKSYYKKAAKLTINLYRGDENVTCVATNVLGEARRELMVALNGVIFPLKETTLQQNVINQNVTFATAGETASGNIGTVIAVVVPVTLLVIVSGLLFGHLCYKRRVRKNSDDRSKRPLPQKPLHSYDSCRQNTGRESKALSVVSNHLYEDVKEVSKYEALLPLRAQHEYMRATTPRGTTLKPPVIDPIPKAFVETTEMAKDVDRPESNMKLDSSGPTLPKSATSLHTNTLDSLGNINRATSDYVRPDSYVQPELHLDPIQMNTKLNEELLPDQNY